MMEIICISARAVEKLLDPNINKLLSYKYALKFNSSCKSTKVNVLKDCLCDLSTEGNDYSKQC